MKYARIIDNVAAEVIDFNPAGRFTGAVASMFEEVPDGTGANDTRNADGTWTKFVAPPAIEVPVDPDIAVLRELADLDAKSGIPRALREALLGDTTWLAALEAQAVALRGRLK